MVATEDTCLIDGHNLREENQITPSVTRLSKRFTHIVILVSIFGLLAYVYNEKSTDTSQTTISTQAMTPCYSRPDKLDECELNNEYAQKENTKKGDWLFQNDRSNGTESEWPSEPDPNTDVDFESLDSLGYLHYVDTSQEPMGVCLDGSTPAYWLRRGFGKGQTKWLVHLKGGGWCTSHEDCEEWVTSQAVNTSLLPQNMTFGGIMAIDPKYNPDFFDWNIVYVWYCDGASYSGFVEEPYETHRGVTLYFRGASVIRSVLKDLMWAKSMSTASEVFLTGTSAGGLGVLHQCDLVKDLIMETRKDDDQNSEKSVKHNDLLAVEENTNDIKATSKGEDSSGSKDLPDGRDTPESHDTSQRTDKKLKCLSDAGWFVDTMNWEGHYSHGHLFQNVTTIQNVTANLDYQCTSKFPEKDRWRCFFPMNSFQYISTPTFIINSAIDYYQLTNFFFFHSNSGYECVTYPLTECNADMFAKIQDFHSAFMDTVSTIRESKKHGSFIDTCMAHAQTTRNKLYYLPKINNVTMSEAVRRWYYQDDTVISHIDERAWPYVGQVCDWGPIYEQFVENDGFLISQSDFVLELTSGENAFDLQKELSLQTNDRTYDSLEPDLF